MNFALHPTPPVPPDVVRAVTMFTRAEAAKLLRCSVTNIDRRTKSGELKPTRVGGRVFYSLASITAYCGQPLQQVAA
jgi:hypothetical protein